MTVKNGLSNLYIDGRDLSGELGVFSKIGGGAALLDVNSLLLAGAQRIPGRYDGEISYNVYLNPAAGSAHAYLSTLPTGDAPVMVPIPPSLEGEVAMLIAKRINYDPAIGADLSASFSVQALASQGVPLEWGKLITNGKRTDTVATASGTGIDLGLPRGVDAVAILTSSIANPTHIVTDGAHGLVTGESVVIAGHTSVTPDINGEYTVTRISDTEFTIPIEVTADGVGGTVQRTSHRGWAAQNQMFGVTGTSVTVTIQDAHENVAGTFANLTGGAFTAVTQVGAPAAQRIASAAGIVRRYVRVKTTGTFTSGIFATAIYTTEG